MNKLLIFRYLPLLYLAGALIINLDEGFGFARAIDVSLGTMFTSTTGVSLVIACILAWAYYFYDRGKQNSSEQNIQQPATPAPQITNTEPDTKFYEQALAELDSDDRDTGIWAKAYAEADNEEASRKLYVKLRATQLMHEQTISTVSEVPTGEEIPDKEPAPQTPKKSITWPVYV